MATVFTNELTLADPDFFQSGLAKRIKHILRTKIPESSLVWNDLNVLWDQKVLVRPAILHPDIFYWIENNRSQNIYGEIELLELSNIVKKIIVSIELTGQSRQDFLVGIDIKNDSMKVAERLKRAEIAAVDAGAKISLSVIPCDVELLKKSLSILRQNNQAIFSEIERFITNIVMFEGQTIIGFTDFHNHGAIFIKYAMVKDNPTFLAEEIVHESSHTVLNTIMVLDPLVKNPKNERYKTPLRQDERPMFGLFHQLYVLSKLNRFYENLKGHKETSRHEQIKEKLMAAVDIVGKNAQFTPKGEQIFSELKGFCS